MMVQEHVCEEARQRCVVGRVSATPYSHPFCLRYRCVRLASRLHTPAPQAVMVRRPPAIATFFLNMIYCTDCCAAGVSQ